MNSLIVLVWMLVAPTGEASLVVQPEASQEQCLKDGDLMRMESEAAIKDGSATNFYGACVPVDLSQPGKDKRGSI